MVCFFALFAHQTVFALDPIPPQLADVCVVAAGSSAIHAGSKCAYPGYSSDVQNKIICLTAGPGQMGLYSSICCDTQLQCSQLGPIPTSYITPDSLTACESAGNPAGCSECMNQESGVWTAIGCIQTTPEGLINTFLPFGIGIAGGIAFLLILFGALQVMTSAGNPEKLHAGGELITAAISGLLLIIFSIFILQLIGVKILVIPKFG